MGAGGGCHWEPAVRTLNIGGERWMTANRITAIQSRL